MPMNASPCMQDDYLGRGGGSLEREAGDLKQGEEVESGMTSVGGGGGHEIEKGHATPNRVN